MMFVGTFKQFDDNGKRVVYERGQQVEFQGNLYDCKSRTSDSPVQNTDAWSFTSGSRIFTNSLPPASPIDGQMWTDSNGVTYKWYFDGSQFQWVEV